MGGVSKCFREKDDGKDFGKKVVMVPGNEFRLEPSPKAFFRMNFSFLKEAEMEEGVKRINAVYRDIIT